MLNRPLIAVLLATAVSRITLACDITSVQFQQEALAVLEKEYPERHFRPGTTTDVIVMGEVELGLPNLRSKLCLANPSLDVKARQEAMRTHFAAMMQLISEHESRMPTTWADAKHRVFPQLVSSDYLKLMNDARGLVARSFVPGVKLAVVVDRENGYGYVREEDRVRWAIDQDVLFETALGNLDQVKGNAKLKGGSDPDRFLAVEEKDGYDAARLLIPWVRQEAAKFLGEPFLASVPNRDFLIMWSANNSPGFQEMAKKNVREDFQSQPYPLSPFTLRVWGNGRVEVVQ